MHTLHTQAFNKGPYGPIEQTTENKYTTLGSQGEFLLVTKKAHRTHTYRHPSHRQTRKKKVPTIPGACTIVDPGSPQFSGLKIHSKHTHVTHAHPINTLQLYQNKA